MQEFDLIVIGTGSGLEVSADAAARGKSVAIVENGPFGGTCLNRGCIPSKMLIHSADVMETIKTAHLFGIDAHVESIDWDMIMRRASEEVDHDAHEIEQGNRSIDNIEVFKSDGRFVDTKVLEIDGTQITADIIVIAAGTRPYVPESLGLSGVPFITSDEALRLPKQPARLAVIGAGYISAELAHFYGSLGTDITIICRGDVLLRAEDEDISRRFTEVYSRRFNVMLRSVIRSARMDGEEIVLEVEADGSPQEVRSDAVLVATGRVPNTDTLNVEGTGVEVDERGYIKTDATLETSTPGIWALGDIVGRFLLKHSANLEASYVTYNIAHPDHRAEVDYHAMPHAIFAGPQVGGVGATERELKESGTHYVSATYNYYDTAYGSSIEDKDGFVKVMADPESGEILGCHIIGTDAATLIQEVANPMRTRATADAVTQAIYVHPALPEVVQRAFGELGV
ncbi:MAG: dihydrolipoyl dehydrogenase [Chloroflexi bacterium]|nr:dihydrolipoyl dehydrogenase [Chloroflexota bacterium]